VPKNPAPGKMVGIPALKCGCDVAGKNDVRCIGGNAKNDQTFRKRGENESHGEGIESAGGQAGQHMQCQHDPEVRRKRQEKRSKREDGSSEKEDATGPINYAQEHAENTAKHHGHI